MALSHYLVKKWLDRSLGSQAYTDPATVYLGLFTSAPSASGGGTELTPGTGAYARKALASNNTIFPDAILGTGQKFLGSDQVFSAATTDWGTISHVALFDASTGGNMLHFGALTTPLTILTGDIFRISLGSGGLLVTLT